MSLDLVAYQQALELIERIDRMPSTKGVKEIATPRAQGALELIGKMKGRFAAVVDKEAEDDE